MDDKQQKALFHRFSKKRVSVINREKNERRQIKSVLRDNGVVDLAEFESCEEAWEKLQLSTTCVLIFSTGEQEGLDFLQNLVDSARFKRTPMIIFTNRIKEHPKLFANEDLLVWWEELPMNGYKVEQALIKVYENGVVEKSLLGRDHESLNRYSKAGEAMANGKYEEAKELLRLALKEKPDFFEGYVKMAETLIALRDFEVAKRVLQKADSMRPGHPRVLSLKAELAAETLDKEKALKAFDAVVAKRPDDLMFIIDIGNLAMEKNWVEDAIRYYETAKNVDPELIHLYNRLGMAYSRTGEFDKAQRMYENALGIDDGDAGIHFNMGVMFCRQGNKEKAREYFEKASRLNPGLTESQDWLARLDEECGV